MTIAMRHIIMLLTAVACALLASCGSGKSAEAESASAIALDEFTDTVYAPEFARRFVVTKAPGKQSLLLTVNNPWQGADSKSSQLLLLRGGETAPAGFTGAVVDSVASRMVAMSTTNVAMLDCLDELDKVVAVSGRRFLTTPRLPKDIIDAGNEADADFEAIVSAAPDLALIYGVSTPSVMEPKLKQLNIPYVYIADYLEQSPLGRAEWLVALGYLTGREKEAIDRFSETALRYNDLKSSIDELPAGKRPKVMLNAPYNDAWFMPDRNSYMVTLITDAGGRYINDSNSTGTSVAVGDEEAFMMAQQSDIWLCPGSFATIKELTATLPRFASARPVKNGQVWNNTLQATSTGGNDFYESGSVNPDRILEDLIEIINPGDHDYQPYYFKQLR